MQIYQRFLPYAVAITSTAIAVLLTLWLDPLLHHTTAAFFYTAITVSSWYGGLRPGIVAIVLSVLALNYYLIPPTHQIYITSLEDNVWLGLFAIVSLIITLLTTNLQESRKKIEQLNRQLITESSDRLQIALNAAQMGMWDWDIVARQIIWSPEHERLFGLSPGCFDGKYETFENCVHPDDREGLNQVVARSLQDHIPYCHEFRVIWPDGSLHWIEGRGQVFYNKAGQPVRMSGTVMAISERKQAQLLLQQQFEQQRLVMEVTQRIRQSLNLSEILQTTVDEVRQFLQTDRVIIFQLFANGDGIVAVESCGVNWTPILSTQINDPCFNETYIEPFRQGLVIARSNIYTAGIRDCHIELLSNFQVRANLVVPILQDQQLWGLLIAHHCASPRPWQDSEIYLLQQIAAQVSIALQQSTLLEQLQTELKERQQVEASLRESQKQIQQQLSEIETIYQSAPIGLNVLDSELRFIRINQRLAEINGLPVEAHIGRTVRSVLPTLADTAESLLRQILETGEPLLNVEISGETPAQPGVRRTWLESFLPLKQGDRIIGINTVCQEITERKQAEQALAKELLRIQALFDASFDGIVILDKAGQVLDANPRFAQMLGYTPEEMATLTVFDWDAYLTPEELQQSLQDAMISHHGVLETQHRRKDGSIYDVEISYNVVEWEGEILRFCVCRDISQRKRTQKALQQRETVLRLFARYAPAEIAMFDRDMGYLMASQRWVDDFQLNSIASLIGRSHYEIFPDIPERWRQIHQRCLAGAIEKCDEDLFVRADGVHQWIRWEVHPWYTATDEIGGIIIFSEDITQRKQAEASILQLNRELQQKVTELQTLLDVIPIGIGIAEDPECRRIRVNPAFAVNLGIPATANASLSAPQGERPTNFKVYQNGREMALTELPLQYAATHGVEVRDLEVEVIWEDGTIITLLEYAAPLFDEQGQTRGSVGAFLNITERKRAEVALRESEERYRILAHNFPNGAVLLFDHDLRYVLAEGQELREIGFNDTLLEGKTLWQVVDPQTCRLLEPYYQDVLAGHCQVAEIPFADRIYRTHFLPLHNDQGSVELGMVMLQDITLQQKAEQALRRSRDELDRQVQERTQELRETNERLERREREFRTLVENTPDVISRHDRQYRYLYINPASIQQAAIPVEAYLGKKPSELDYRQEITDFWEASLENVFVTGQMRIEEFQVFTLNDRKTYQTYFVPEFGTEGTVESVLTISRDITALRKAEESARHLADDLKRSNQELEQFAYIASHDLQEPLRAVASFTQLLAKRYRGQLDTKADTYIEFIVNGAVRMQQLIKDLLAYSRVGRSELKLQSVDCNLLLEAVKRDLQVAIAETEAVITADPLPTVSADPNQLGNLLLNLISNALKYRSELPPGIHLSVQKNPLQSPIENPGESFSLSATRVQEEWVFSIQDNGIGIEPQYAERIFVIFQRLHSNDEYPGTGLGLAICKKIIERHQGRIWVESQLGQGSTFFFTIPTCSNDTL